VWFTVQRNTVYGSLCKGVRVCGSLCNGVLCMVDCTKEYCVWFNVQRSSRV